MNYGIGGYAGFGGGGFGCGSSGCGYDSSSDDEPPLKKRLLKKRPLKKRLLKKRPLNTNVKYLNQSRKAARGGYGRRLKRARKVQYGLNNFGLRNRRFL
tara:strand:+ start:617 stop:913 length:297 start_codon:yes stop_codon:yes gene_type:complete